MELAVSQLLRRRRMRSLKMRGATGVLATLIGIATLIALTAATPGHANDPLILPDLRQAPVGCPGSYGGDPSRCTDWDVCMVRDNAAEAPDCVDSGSIKQVRLRFTTSEENIGNGPLLLYGHRDNTDQVTMSVRQAFQVGEHGSIPGSYTTAQREVNEAMYYDLVHQRWYLLNFAHMELRKLNGDTVVSDRNNGFCIGDRYTVADAGNFVHSVKQDNSPEGRVAAILGNNSYCKFKDSSALDVTEGISVGRGDNYVYNIAFQWIDITHVPSGTYVIVNTVNSDHSLLESNYNNNSSAIAISLQWPGAAHDPPSVITLPPVVTLLNSCPGRAQCSAP